MVDKRFCRASICLFRYVLVPLCSCVGILNSDASQVLNNHLYVWLFEVFIKQPYQTILPTDTFHSSTLKIRTFGQDKSAEEDLEGREFEAPPEPEAHGFRVHLVTFCGCNLAIAGCIAHECARDFSAQFIRGLTIVQEPLSLIMMFGARLMS